MTQARKMWVAMGGERTNILDPPNWLFNQQKMRAIYEDARSNESHPLNMSNVLMEYMKFMYTSFPSGYREILMQQLKA